MTTMTMATVVTHDLQTRILPPVPNSSTLAMRETHAKLAGWPAPAPSRARCP